MDKADTDLSQKYLLNGWEDKVVQAYFKFMVDIAEYFGAERTQAKKELINVLNLQIELANVSAFLITFEFICKARYFRRYLYQSRSGGISLCFTIRWP